ncbi:MAG TPA: hypothetical protein VL551_04050 [Actinospica sp.]|jgi:hypothetical protein|nr:hypothetical protein [Actinospica sp.]
MATRLETRSAELSQLIEAADAHQQRLIAVKTAQAALAAVPIDEPELALARADLTAGRWGGEGAQAATALTDRLDDLAFDLQDEVDEGTAEQAEYLEAFRRARAVSAAAFALDPDPRNAALEAAYEAEAATENLALITGIVNEVLGIEPTPDAP